MSTHVRCILYLATAVMVVLNLIGLVNPIINFRDEWHYRFSTELIIIHISFIILGVVICYLIEKTDKSN